MKLESLPSYSYSQPQMFTNTFLVLTLALFARAQSSTPLCTSGECYTSPANATSSGCQVWAGGVTAWDTCSFEGAVTCTTCLSCVENGSAAAGGCYTSPAQAVGAGCSSWAGGVDVWQTCGFDGAVCLPFPPPSEADATVADYLQQLFVDEDEILTAWTLIEL
ncbi:hypothetical protein FB45DRAFT_425280 [Roridomyces roridus]|uniref:Uncharacterized protein n=1 Tax=Roridomyces roridus TaxID=1738132 RepID=A0AAD7C5P8_9AGAR|nr:hypothetical protein FB45DRAFT_425280 [Roridomyces roridus]